MATMMLLDALPPSLRERCRVLRQADHATSGEFVLVWLHHAIRADENPLLAVAVRLAARLGLPLLLYQGLGGRHPHNSDRHHAFILAGARDLARDLAAHGLRLEFHLPADPAQPGPLPALVRRAALTLVEDWPAPPFPRWCRALQAQAAGAVIAVDASCVVPMQQVSQRHQRAYAFRAEVGAEQLRRAALPLDWELAGHGAVSYSGELGFTPFDLESDHSEAIAGCAIDHGVGAVTASLGGSQAGYARWRAFVDGGGLARYADQRNDAALDGVSRLSPYLHHGQVSPFRIAREALAHGGRGAAKFLDELLVWRELAFNLAWQVDQAGLELDSPAVLPAWARATLAEHAGDPRPSLSEEALARGRSGDDLWDAAQRSLLIRGELHNNLRMTWGKALVAWSDSLPQAMARLTWLNHRYALDGSDPNSWAGLWWCLGLYDRPFHPPQPVIGSLRPRPLRAHRSRLDLPAYAARTARPATGALDIVVVGAGVAGALAAALLADQGHRVRLHDKGRGAGGRMSTRRAEPWRFDLGGRRFRLQRPELQALRRQWLADGVLQQAADGQLEPCGHANGFVRHLLDGLQVRFASRVAEIRRDAAGYSLHDEDGTCLDRCQWLLLAVPPLQASALLAPAGLPWAQELSALPMAPAWVTMLGWATALPAALANRLQALPCDQRPIARILHEPSTAAAAHSSERWPVMARRTPSSPLDAVSTTPARSSGPRAAPRRHLVALATNAPETCGLANWRLAQSAEGACGLVLEAGAAWSTQRLEQDPGEVARQMHAWLDAALDGELSAQLGPPQLLQAHRWRYARAAAAPFGTRIDARLGLGLAGDWCEGDDIEAALLSGQRLAGLVQLACLAGTTPDENAGPVMV